jgi:prenyltransferase beta subunit
MSAPQLTGIVERCELFLRAGRRADGGFAREQGEPSDAWTTAEALLAFRGRSETEDIISAGQAWLIAHQLRDGSWRAQAYAELSHGGGDVAATAYAVRALIWSGLSPSSDEIARARAWLLEAQRPDGGWAVSLAAEPFAHVGLTAYAVSALTLCPPRDHLTAESIQRGLFCLHRSRVAEGGWPLCPGGAPDATISGYAVRAVLDAFASRGYEPRVHDLLQFVDLWRRRQSEAGSWSDWYGNKASVEATAYMLEILCCLYSDSTSSLMKSAMIDAGVSFLRQSQNNDGGYAITQGGPSSLWVTHNVVLGLRSLMRDPEVPCLRAPETFFPSIDGAAIASSLDRYDVSISFEAEHRGFADLLAFRMLSRGLSVFYDRLDPARIWGSQLPELFEQAFAQKSEYCIVLLSEAYLRKPWPMFELRQLQTRLVFEKRGSILPVIMSDEVVPPDYLRTVGYLRASEMNIEDIVELVLQKVRSSK